MSDHLGSILPTYTNLSRGVKHGQQKNAVTSGIIVLQGLVQRQGSNWTQPRQPSKVLATVFFSTTHMGKMVILLMDEIPNNHLGWLKPYK